MVSGKRLGWAGALVLVASGCFHATTARLTASGLIRIVAAENEYGDVAAQVGGRYVSVDSVESNPSTDPHDYEVSASVAGSVASASVVIENGLGYDSFMGHVLSSTPANGRQVIDVQKLRRLPGSATNPHLWYDPATMPAVARQLAADLAADQPDHAAYFRANATRFTASLSGWLTEIAAFRSAHTGAPVATTEPVADYLLDAMGADTRTPSGFQDDIMNGVDLSPQQVTLEDRLISQHQVKALVYNQQVTDSVTQGFIRLAHHAGVPVVGVYETMPTPGYDYQSWMQAETAAIQKAVVGGVSTEHL
ncbi:MAG TPA: zinc ABC transporter substrate-binding protein [Acidimicrobiales bacterium]|nr:zinc ABC transporter substrate-binding protein [Acidimicrobiales bacterium]